MISSSENYRTLSLGLIWSISWKYPRLCNDLGNIKVLFNAMTLELFHGIHCGAMQYSFENKIHFVLVTFNSRVVFRSIGCLRSATTWVRKIRSVKQGERSLAAYSDCFPHCPSAHNVWRSCNSPARLGLSLAPGITWPAVSSLIGCRQTTCGFSPLCKLCCEFDPQPDFPPRGIIMPHCVSGYIMTLSLTSVPWSLLHVTAALTSVRCLLIPLLLSPPARPESPCAPRVPGLSPITSGCWQQQHAVDLLLLRSAWRAQCPPLPGGLTPVLNITGAVLILLVFPINPELVLQIDRM